MDKKRRPLHPAPRSGDSWIASSVGQPSQSKSDPWEFMNWPIDLTDKQKPTLTKGLKLHPTAGYRPKVVRHAS